MVAAPFIDPDKGNLTGCGVFDGQRVLPRGWEGMVDDCVSVSTFGIAVRKLLIYRKKNVILLHNFRTLGILFIVSVDVYK